MNNPTNPTPSPELLPCPFCGSPAELKHDYGNEVWGQSWRVRCTRCWLEGPKVYGSSSWRVVKKEDEAAKASAIELWQTRTSPRPPSADVVERVARAMVAVYNEASSNGVGGVCETDREAARAAIAVLSKPGSEG